MGFDVPEAFIHKTSAITDRCVISGKDPVTLNERIEAAIQMFPSLDMKDLQMKMEKDVGVWITYIAEDDNINTIDFPIGWSAGNTALHLACQQGATEIYILGFDLSSYDEPLNNIYKGTDNYLSSDARGFNPVNWQNQMQTVFREFKDVQFSWVDAKEEFIQENNLSYLTKADFCDKVVTL
jgi:ankyrin repeat protein